MSQSIQLLDALKRPIQLGDYVMHARYCGGALHGPYLVEEVKHYFSTTSSWIANPKAGQPNEPAGAYQTTKVPQVKIAFRPLDWRGKSRSRRWYSRGASLIVVPAPVP